MTESLIALIHSEPKIGKTKLGLTCPAPRLILDSENGSRFFVTNRERVYWNPLSDPPPEAGEWTTCVVLVRDYAVMASAYKWLNSGKHPFRSVVLDSITEIQKRCKDNIIGSDDVVTERQWGQLLVRMERLVRDFRDLTMHPSNPLQVVLFLALTNDYGAKAKPLIQGGLGKSITGFVDLIGYIAAVDEMDADGNTIRTRRLLVSPHANFEAGDRTGFFEPQVALDNPNITAMHEDLNEFLEGRQ